MGCHLWSCTESDTTEATEQQQQLVAQTVKNLPAMQETWVQSLDWEDPLEKGIASHSSVLAWRIPWTEEPGGLQSTGSKREVHDCAILRISLCIQKF